MNDDRLRRRKIHINHFPRQNGCLKQPLPAPNKLGDVQTSGKNEFSNCKHAPSSRFVNWPCMFRASTNQKRFKSIPQDKPESASMIHIWRLCPTRECLRCIIPLKKMKCSAYCETIRFENCGKNTPAALSRLGTFSEKETFEALSRCLLAPRTCCIKSTRSNSLSPAV